MTSREFRERLTRRAAFAGVLLPEGLLGQLEAYYRLLTRWNAKINLTALHLKEFDDQAVDRLLIEPLAAVPLVEDAPLTWFDLGSGGGSPAIPLKIARPSAVLTMVESKGRKAAFLREAVRTLGLVGARVENARFEDIASAIESASADLLTIRAVKIDDKLSDVGRALLQPGGRFILFGTSRVSTDTPLGFRLPENAGPSGVGDKPRITVWVRTQVVPRGTTTR